MVQGSKHTLFNSIIITWTKGAIVYLYYNICHIGLEKLLISWMEATYYEGFSRAIHNTYYNYSSSIGPFFPLFFHE